MQLQIDFHKREQSHCFLLQLLFIPAHSATKMKLITSLAAVSNCIIVLLAVFYDINQVINFSSLIYQLAWLCHDVGL